MDYDAISKELTTRLELAAPPVALAFLDEPPAGVERAAGTAPSGCTFWKRAAAGEVFYTEPEDHFNCPIGCFTHGIQLPGERASELEGTLGTMVGLGYIAQDEIPDIPHFERPAKAIVYAPLALSPAAPDLVLVQVDAYQGMVLTEAARGAGVAHETRTLGRPACSLVPATMGEETVTLSLGCIGNRTYTDLPRDRMYVAIPGRKLADVVAGLDTVHAANAELAGYHQDRRASLTL